MAHLLPAVRGLTVATTDAPPASPRDRAPRTLVVLAAVLAVLVVLAGVVLVRQLLDTPQPAGTPDGTSPLVAGAVVESEAAKRAGLVAATEATETVLSYRAATFGRDVDRARELLSGPVRERYDATMERLAGQTRKDRAAVEATVVAASIISATDDDATALLFVNQVTTGRHLDGPRTERNRVVVRVQREEGSWRVTRLEAL